MRHHVLNFFLIEKTKVREKYIVYSLYCIKETTTYKQEALIISIYVASRYQGRTLKLIEKYDRMGFAPPQKKKKSFSKESIKIGKHMEKLLKWR